jgi:hypothetical protein
MRASSRLALLCAWASTAAFAACGDAFSSGAGAGDGGAQDAAGGDVAANDGPPASDVGSVDGGSPDSAHEAGHADALPPADGPAHGDAASDGIVVQDVVGIDAVTLDVVTGPPKRVFVTSASYDGNLGGLSGADQSCQLLADAATLGGTFKAWLSSTTTSASERLTHSTGPYTLINGTKVASSWAGLTSGALLVPINVNEKGGPPPAQPAACGSVNVPVVWTSTSPTGALGTTQGATCADWTTSSSSNGAVFGLADHADASWTDGCSVQAAGSLICATSAALYCFEQ